MPVEFVTIDGRTIPLHPFGGCGGKNGQPNSNIVRSPESQCVKTSCKQCGDSVFFIRHNGGSVFIDPPLGPPWNRHPCMAKTHAPKEAKQDQDATYISPSARELLSKVRGLITGVVIEADVLPRQRGAILTIAVAETEPLILLMRSPSTYFVGKLVILRPAKRLLYSAESPADLFIVEKALYVPDSLRDPEFPLLLEGAKKPVITDEARTSAFLNGQPKAVCKAYRKFIANGINADWKVHQLASIVHLLEDRQQNEVVHRAAVLTLERYASDGDLSEVPTIAKALHPGKRDMLARWYEQFSPIRIDLSRKDRKVWARRAPDGTRLAVDLRGAKANPFFKRLPNAG